MQRWSWRSSPAQGAESGVNIALNQTGSTVRRTRSTCASAGSRMFVGWSLGEPSRGGYDRSYLDQLAADVARLPGARRQDAVRRPGHAGLGGRPSRARSRRPGDPATYGEVPRRARPLRPRGRRDRDLERARFGHLLARRARPGGLCGPAARASYPLHQGGAERHGHRGHRRNGRQPLRVPAGHLRRGRRRQPSTRSACTPTPACLLTSPAEFYREPNGRVGRYSFTGYREVHDVMAAHGDEHRGGAEMTEIGWGTGSRRARSCKDGAVAGTRAEGVEREDPGALPQAGLSLPGRRPGRARGAVVLAAGRRPQHGLGDHLGLIRKGGKRKPAFRAMRKVRNGRISAPRAYAAAPPTAPRRAWPSSGQPPGATLADGRTPARWR